MERWLTECLTSCALVIICDGGWVPVTTCSLKQEVNSIFTSFELPQYHHDSTNLRSGALPWCVVGIYEAPDAATWMPVYASDICLKPRKWYPNFSSLLGFWQGKNSTAFVFIMRQWGRASSWIYIGWKANASLVAIVKNWKESKNKLYGAYVTFSVLMIKQTINRQMTKVAKHFNTYLNIMSWTSTLNLLVPTNVASLPLGSDSHFDWAFVQVSLIECSVTHFSLYVLDPLEHAEVHNNYRM